MDSGRVLDVFAEACDRAPQERASYLTQACAGDEDLRIEVNALLQCHEAAADFLEKPAIEAGAEWLADAVAEGELRAGDVLGDCRIVSLIGVGGMGEVYLADDTTLGRRVAIKLIQRGQGGTLLRHFRHERRVLAALNHPDIARLYGSAVNPEGRAYLVMEYIEGERLDTYCDGHRLDVGERLALFRKVCAAVAYAHQNLVIHRDLKPANIRVTAQGEPKLLDFGIAKLLETDTTPTGAGAEPTLTLNAMMTPEYASPEQLRAETMTTASDVYSLGVILYELLSGHRPYQLKSRRPEEVARIICEQDPERPSVAAARMDHPPGAKSESSASSRKLCRRLQGDLDNIVAKAMHKEPGRRYQSVAQFADDIRRHCEGLPVTARRDTLAYRANKFARRNKAAVAGALLIVLALVGGLATTTWQARRADRRFEDVRRLANSLLFEMEPQIASLPGGTEARRTLVKRALEYLDNLSREAGGNQDLRRELASAYEKVGNVQGNPSVSNLGDFKGAQASFRKALELRKSLATDDLRDPPVHH